jgi:prophage regulatory protein
MRIMRLNEVKAVTGLQRSSIYKYMAIGTFPKAVPLSDKAVGWVSTEIDDWIKDRIAERDKHSYRQPAGYLSDGPRARG